MTDTALSDKCAAVAVDILDQSVDVLLLTVRAHNSLTRTANWIDGKGYDVRVRDVIAKTKSELLREPNFGKASLKNVREALAEHGLYLRDDEPPKHRSAVEPPAVSPPTLSQRLQAIEAKLDFLIIISSGASVDSTHRATASRARSARPRFPGGSSAQYWVSAARQ